jgi:cytidylate kinase
MGDPALASPSVMIAIDGPSGSGKSSVSRAVARRLGVGYLDTGAMYRALTWWCLDQGIDLEDREAVAAAADSMPLEQGTDPDVPAVLMDGRDIATDIRGERITHHVTAVATNPLVRPVLQRRQRAAMGEIADRQGGVVAEGRDITTVVAPDAEVRILLTASEEARLRRRARENHGEAGEAAVAATRDSIVERDRADATVSEFSVAADGVTHVDTSDLDLEQSVEAFLALVAAARPS